MMNNRMVWLAALALVAPACKKHEGAGGAKAAGGAFPDEVAKWTPAKTQDLLQGAWTTRITFPDLKTMDAPVALEITGDNVKAFDGEKEHTMTLQIDSPCQFSLVEAISNGTSSYPKHFLVQDGKLVAVGDGGAGYRKGKEAIACQGGMDPLVTMDASGACKSWELDFMDKKTWNSKPIQCAWAQKDGKDQLVIGKPDDNFTIPLVAEGDLLWTDQLHDEAKSERYMKHMSDYAAAKAALAGMK